MLEIKKVYDLMKGAISSIGNGDYVEQGRFNTLEAAKRYFNLIKNDVSGYSKNLILDTLIEVHFESNDEELNESLEEAMYRSCDNIICSFEYKI